MDRTYFEKAAVVYPEFLSVIEDSKAAAKAYDTWRSAGSEGKMPESVNKLLETPYGAFEVG